MTRRPEVASMLPESFRTTAVRCPVLLALVCVLAASPAARAQGNPGPGDWGDAPEGVIAYPALGVGGLFPSCFGGPAGFIWHGNPGLPADMYWGFNVDDEIDGNAGFCPPPPYERDECWGPFDGDGGLASPAGTFTINAGLVVPCGPSPPVALGLTCQVLTIFPGGPFEANLVNNFPGPGYINVLFDWNQDGVWAGAAPCAGLVPEHAIVNLPVPPLYVGPLSGLSPGPVQIGPNPGYVWARLTISNQPVPQGWDGSGLFDLGETEDYLLRVDDSGQAGEYGDAPEGALAYPASGVAGEFPTCIAVLPAGFVFHAASGQSYFGPFVDYEGDGNATTCPQPPYDLDECAAAPGNDAGLLFPSALSLTNTGAIAVCPNASPGGWTGCFTARWGVDVDITATNNTSDDRYVNVLVDWDADGKWTTALQTCPQGSVVEEHVLVDLVVPAGFSGALSSLSPPDFTIGAPPDQLCWTRFTISDAPVGPGWDGAASFGDGETEDYLFRVAAPPVDAPELGEAPRDGAGALRVESVRPNPARAGGASIRFATAHRGRVMVDVHDSAGRRVARVREATLDAGAHTVAWDGRDAAGAPVTPGVYFVHTRLDAEAVTVKLVVVH